MAIYELESAHQVGLIRWGTRLGRRVDQVEGGISVQEKTWYEGTGSCVVAGRREPISWGDCSGLFVTMKGGGVVALTTWADTDAYGYVQTTLGDLTGQEINEHPIVGRKLRYIPD